MLRRKTRKKLQLIKIQISANVRIFFFFLTAVEKKKSFVSVSHSGGLDLPQTLFFDWPPIWHIIHYNIRFRLNAKHLMIKACGDQNKTFSLRSVSLRKATQRCQSAAPRSRQCTTWRRCLHLTWSRNAGCWDRPWVPQDQLCPTAPSQLNSITAPFH